jgi:hypothetical protein
MKLPELVRAWSHHNEMSIREAAKVIGIPDVPAISGKVRKVKLQPAVARRHRALAEFWRNFTPGARGRPFFLVPVLVSVAF